MLCLQIGRDKTPVYRMSFLIVFCAIVGLAVIMIGIGVTVGLCRRGNDNDSCELQMDSLSAETPQSILEDNGSSDCQGTRLEISSVDRRLEDSKTKLQNTNFARGAPSPDSRRSDLPMHDVSNGISGPGRNIETDAQIYQRRITLFSRQCPFRIAHMLTSNTNDLGKTFPSPYQSSEL